MLWQIVGRNESYCLFFDSGVEISTASFECRLKNNYPLENILDGTLLEQNIQEMISLDQSERLEEMAAEMEASLAKH